MIFEALEIPGAFRIRCEPQRDDRGSFMRTFCAREFEAAGMPTHFAQHSISLNLRRGTLRGIHYQIAPHEEGKLVQCIAGEAFDVMVDLRRSSPAFGRWYGEIVSSARETMLYVPAGCAHGFQTTLDHTSLLYRITNFYEPDAGHGVAWNDPDLSISWPITEAIVSSADSNRPALAEAVLFD